MTESDFDAKRFGVLYDADGLPSAIIDRHQLSAEAQLLALELAAASSDTHAVSTILANTRQGTDPGALPYVLQGALRYMATELLNTALNAIDDFRPIVASVSPKTVPALDFRAAMKVAAERHRERLGDQ
ncbi:hypothetical protein [Prescottella equi]|uniref:hypothetical protein n=1 Tax=Rhodococcus hoagii TaxID=43767 RepID=UPI001584AD65|nr:hypothetical protein [Prescottella equi]